jgi:hypothetical protein
MLRWPKFVGALVVVAALAATQVACSRTPIDSCQTRCMKDAACQQAIVSEGIAPAGSFDGGLCNGICSALRTTARGDAKLAKDLGVNAPPLAHPCLPQKTNPPN